MAIDTKPNFSCTKFEQCSDDVMNLSGCTQIYGIFDIESGSTLSICDNAGVSKVLTSDASGVATWETVGGGSITGGANGLSTSGVNVVLGGALTGDTTISGAHILALSSLTAFNATATDIGLTGAVGVIGAIDAESTLDILGATSLHSTLDVTGATSLSAVATYLSDLSPFTARQIPDAEWVTGCTTGGGLYSNNSPATCTVGGITAGATLTGQTLEYLLQEMLAPYIEPAFSAFAVNITSPVEVGTVVDGTKSFTWATSTCDNVATNSIGILNVTSGTTLGTGLANDYAENLSIGTLTNAAPQTWTFRITGCSTQSSSFNKNVSKCSVYPYFWGVETCGVCPTIDSALVNTGTPVVLAVGTSISVTFGSSSEWTWFAMPEICADRTKWFVAVGNCGFVDRGCASDKYPNSCILDVTDSGGCWSAVSYKVYMSGFAATDGEPIAFRTY